jgi:hypothetical protein
VITDGVNLRRRIAAAVVAVTMTMGLFLVTAPAAVAEERTCKGSLGAITVDNLRVPEGASCTLTGTTVKGTVKVESRATLVANGIRVIGNVQAENAKKVVVRAGSRVGGSVQIVQGRSANIVRTKINGDILFDDQSRPLAAIRNTVGGNIQAFQNTGGIEISSNRVDGNLQCKANVPAPTGGGNIVEGSKEDQCKKL